MFGRQNFYPPTEEEIEERKLRAMKQVDCVHIFKPRTKDIFEGLERVTHVYCEKCLRTETL